MKKTFQLLNVIFLVVTILMNYLSNTGIFNGETMASISAKYPSLFTPAGYAFSIWGLIYLGLFGFVLYYGVFSKNSETKEKTVQKIVNVKHFGVLNLFQFAFSFLVFV